MDKKTFQSNQIKYRVKQFHNKEIFIEGRNGHRIKDRRKVPKKVKADGNKSEGDYMQQSGVLEKGQVENEVNTIWIKKNSADGGKGCHGMELKTAHLERIYNFVRWYWMNHGTGTG